MRRNSIGRWKNNPTKSKKEVEQFWKKIWSNENEHNEEAEWIKRE